SVRERLRQRNRSVNGLIDDQKAGQMHDGHAGNGPGTEYARAEENTEVEVTRSRHPQKTGGLLLVGCVKTKADTAMNARDLYRSPLFNRRREYAEGTARHCYILSARGGLVAPDDCAAPYAP